MKTLQEIKSIISSNLQAKLRQFEGLASDEIGRYNRSIMFGEADEAFPSDAEWSLIVD